MKRTTSRLDDIPRGADGPAAADREPRGRRRRTQAERRAATSRLLLEATIDCIYEEGLARTTVAAVAKRAGLTTGAVQHYFPTRNDLITQVVAAIRERLIPSVRTDAVMAQPLAARVEEICALYWRVFSDRHYIAAVHVQLGVMHDPELSPRVAAAIQRIEKDLDRNWMAAFADIPRSRQRLRAIRYVALAAIRGLAIRRTLRTRKPDWEQERAALVEMVVGALS